MLDFCILFSVVTPYNSPKIFSHDSKHGCFHYYGGLYEMKIGFTTYMISQLIMCRSKLTFHQVADVVLSLGGALFLSLVGEWMLLSV